MEEEAWEDISLPPLNDHHSPGTSISITLNNNDPNFPSMILQDFLAKPIINKEMPSTRSSDRVSNAGETTTTLFGSLPSTSTTLLSLNSGSDVQTIQSDDDDTLRQNPGIKAAATPFYTKLGQEHKENCEDRRHKRRMKNRESAARSRARKQAYINELELEVAHLLEENAKLRRQQDMILAAPHKLPKKNTLSRTLTAPF